MRLLVNTYTYTCTCTVPLRCVHVYTYMYMRRKAVIHTLYMYKRVYCTSSWVDERVCEEKRTRSHGVRTRRRTRSHAETNAVARERKRTCPVYCNVKMQGKANRSIQSCYQFSRKRVSCLKLDSNPRSPAYMAGTLPLRQLTKLGTNPGNDMQCKGTKPDKCHT